MLLDDDDDDDTDSRENNENTGDYNELPKHLPHVNLPPLQLVTTNKFGKCKSCPNLNFAADFFSDCQQGSSNSKYARPWQTCTCGPH